MTSGNEGRADRPAEPRARRRWPRAVAVGIVGLLALPSVLLLPSVQRRIVLGLFPAGTGAALEFDDLRVGLLGAQVRGLRLDWHGLKVSLDEDWA